VLLIYPPSLGCGEYDLERDSTHITTVLEPDLDVRSTCDVRVVEVGCLKDVGCGRHADSCNISFILTIMGSYVEWLGSDGDDGDSRR